MTKLQFLPSENLDQYIRFTIRSKKNNINITLTDYRSALATFEALMKTVKIADDITLDGFNKLNKEMHTIWYSFKRKQKPYIFYYET